MSDFLARIKALQDENLETIRMKNADYASAGDPFQNFTLCERMGICSTEQGMLVRMCDKFQRLVNLLDRDPTVQGETIRDTANDLSNYLLIFVDYLDQKQ